MVATDSRMGGPLSRVVTEKATATTPAAAPTPTTTATKPKAIHPFFSAQSKPSPFCSSDAQPDLSTSDTHFAQPSTGQPINDLIAPDITTGSATQSSNSVADATPQEDETAFAGSSTTQPPAPQSNPNSAKTAYPKQNKAAKSKPAGLKQAKFFGATIDLTTTDDDEPTPARTKARAAKAKPKAATAPKDDDDELVVRAFPKTAARKPARKKATPVRNTAKGAPTTSSDDDALVRVTPRAKADKGKGKANDLGIVEIPDSPPPQKLASMRPLGELTKLGQERRKVQPTLEVRWPSREEHSGGGERRDPVPGPSHSYKPRWPTSSAPSLNSLLAADSFFAQLDRQLHASSSSALPTQAPTLVRHATSALSALIPAFTSHPLLDRLAAPLRAPELSSSIFARATHSSNAGRADHRDLFTTKYGPTMADEMLGTLSRRSAGELKAWFEELAICNAAGKLAPHLGRLLATRLMSLGLLQTPRP